MEAQKGRRLTAEMAAGTTDTSSVTPSPTVTYFTTVIDKLVPLLAASIAITHTTGYQKERPPK